MYLDLLESLSMYLDLLESLSMYLDLLESLKYYSNLSLELSKQYTLKSKSLLKTKNDFKVNSNIFRASG